MYHYQLHPQTQVCHLTSPHYYHQGLVHLSSTFRDKLSTKPLWEREGEWPLDRPKTYMMPWQTCSVCPPYPFPSLLLLDPPALWQPSLPANHSATSCTNLLQHPQSLPSDIIYQSQRQAPLSNLSLETLRIPCVTAYFDLSSYLCLPRLIYNTSLIIYKLSVSLACLHHMYICMHTNVNTYWTYPLSRYLAVNYLTSQRVFSHSTFLFHMMLPHLYNSSGQLILSSILWYILNT